MQRVGLVVGIRPEKIDAYKTLHDNIWADVSAAIRDANLRNFSVFLREPENLLFCYFEYTGTDVDADVARLEALPIYRKWLDVTSSYQIRFDSQGDAPGWAEMVEVFHQD